MTQACYCYLYNIVSHSIIFNATLNYPFFRIITIQSSPDDELQDRNATLTTDTATDNGVNLYILAGHEAMQLWSNQPVHQHNHTSLTHNQYFGAI